MERNNKWEKYSLRRIFLDRVEDRVFRAIWHWLPHESERNGSCILSAELCISVCLSNLMKQLRKWSSVPSTAPSPGVYLLKAHSWVLCIHMACFVIYAFFSPEFAYQRGCLFLSLPVCTAAASTWDYADSALNLFILFCKCTAWWASFLGVNDNGFQLSAGDIWKLHVFNNTCAIQ